MQWSPAPRTGWEEGGAVGYVWKRGIAFCFKYFHGFGVKGNSAQVLGEINHAMRASDIVNSTSSMLLEWTNVSNRLNIICVIT